MYPRFFLLLLSCCFLFLGTEVRAQYLYQKENLQIARDSFGVPHIFGKTDADAAYGLAWAHSEDAFRYIQYNMLAARKRLGEVKGVKGALFDFAVQFFGIDSLVYRRYEQDLSEDFKAVAEAYVQGLNDYARSHPREVLLRGVFPLRPEDLIIGYVSVGLLMAGAGLDLKALNDNIMQEVFAPNERGSNAMAVSPRRSEDGKAWLLSNSHQPLEGEFAWYEAHIHSEEGWNIVGGLFPGGAMAFIGCNEHLAWAHTNNYHNFGEIYRLELSANRRRYRVDGAWKKFDYQRIRLKVRIGFLKIALRRRVPVSEFGPVFKKRHGWYALRYPAATDIRSGEQWFRMNKARNIDEFQEALKMQALPLFNVIYADRSGNLMMSSEGRIPLRTDSLTWTRPLAGNDSRYKWTELLPYEQKVRYLNPDCGYVFNCNGTPLRATCDWLNRCDSFPGLQLFSYNRHERFDRLFRELDGRLITWQDFRRIKYDKAYDPEGSYVRNFRPLFYLDENRYPRLAPSIRLLKDWDLSGDMDDRRASVAMLTNEFLSQKTKMPYAFLMIKEQPLEEADIVSALRRAQRYLLRRFGTVQVPLGLVQRLSRGAESYPVGGLAEVPRAVDVKYDRKSRCFRMTGGDGYIQFVRFGGEGLPEIQSISPYGASTKPESPHYTDQMPLFVNEKLKPMSLDKASVLASAKRIYSPPGGE